jgi:hypothetical protein
MVKIYNFSGSVPVKISSRYLRIFLAPVLMVLVYMFSAYTGWGQVTVFTESMGTVSGTTTIAVHEANNGFDNDAYTMTQGGATNPGDIRATSVSSGYTGASGGANVWLTSTNNAYGFAIEGIDASAYTGLTVQFGYRKEVGTALPTLVLDYWDGSAYVNVPFTFNEAANATAGWYLSPVISLPAGAQISTLKLRWVKSGTVAARLDDVILKGNASTPIIQVTPSALSGFNYSEGEGPSDSQSYELSASNLTPAEGNITVTGSDHYEVSSDNSNFSGSFNVPYTSGTLASTPVYVRLIEDLDAGNYNLEDVTNSGGGASNTTVTCSGFVIGGPVTYAWTGATDNDYQVSSNWSPSRLSPLANDILQFINGGTYTITNVPAQTIAKLSVTSGTKITFQAAAVSTLTIAGDIGDDLVVSGSGSELNISGTNAMSISLSTGATGLVSGSMSFSGTAHKLLAADASAIIFQNGSSFTAGTSLSGNVFGSASPGSVVFQAGSTYIHVSGSNPFGTGTPVVIFQTGSLFKLTGNTTPSFNGKTYADFELDGTGYTITVTGANAVSIDNLTVTNGTLNFNMTANPGHSIKGNITVANGANLNFNPSAAGTVNLNGSALQTISGPGSINSNANSTIVIDNVAGVTQTSAATLNNVSIASGASFITNGTINGSVIVERFISPWTDAFHGWHLISSPVASQSISPAFTDGTPGNYDFYKWDEVTNLWLNQKEVANGINSFTPGTGYLVAYANASTRQFSGTLNTSDVIAGNLTISGGANSGWNLIGNPFSSAIQWNDGTVWTVPGTIAATAKVWNEPNASYTDVAPGSFIPALNGAMVQVLSGSPVSLTIPAAARVHNATPWYKNDQGSITLIAYDRTNNTAQESIIRLNDQATEGYDAAFDSRFIPGYAPQLYSIAGSEYLSTNTLPNLENNRVIEMGFVKNTATEFSIGLDAENLAPGLVVYLTDKKSGAVTELSQGIEYNFIASEGDDASRFLIHFSALGIDDPASRINYSVYAASGNIYINSLENRDADVIISNLAGQVVLTGRTNGNASTMISAGNLQNGVYLVTVKDSDQVVNRKVMISK